MKYFKIIMLLAIINLAVLFAVTLKLPDIVPSHANLYGEIDSYGSKWVIPVFGLLAPAILASMMLYRRRTQNNAKAKQNTNVETVMLSAIAVFFIIIPWVVVAMALSEGRRLPYELIIGVPLGVLMVLLSNYMGVVKQNRWLGVRTKWTLTNEEVWHRTHRVAAYSGVIGGLILIVGSITAHLSGNMYIVMAALIASICLVAFYPLIYSYVIYKKITKQ